MPPQRKQAAPANAAPVVPFDPSKEVLVLDYKGLSALPYSSESHFKSFRAFIFPKGKFVHSPRALARYFVLGNYRVPTALTLVTFAETSNREPELLLNFVQSADCQDVMLETVQTPLKISSGVYQKATRISAIDAVTGFMAIDMGKTPWSTDLSAYLKSIEQFRSLKITNATEMLNHITKPLDTRIASLKTRAELALAAETDALAKQDASIAEETKERHSAKLVALVASMIEHSPEAYDALLSSRITCVELLDAPASAEQVLPAWLTTPLREQLNAGTAAGPRTRFGSPMPRPPDAIDEPEAVAGASGLARPAPPAKGNDDDDDDDDDDEDDDSLVSEDSDEVRHPADDQQVQPPKRARTATDRFQAGSASGKGKTTKQPVHAPASAKGKGKQAEKSAAANLKIGPGVDPNAPFGRNRKGRPYKRACGAYQKNMHEAASLARNNTDAKAAESITQLLEANRKLNDELREALTELAKLKAAGSSAVEVAQLREQAKGHEAYHKAYMEGLERGIAMATGHATRIPASASSF